jgi:hypothetical protein
MGKSRNRILQTLFASVLLLVSFSSLEAKSKKPKEVPRGTPILWRAPTNISTRNLFLGPGGNAMRPDLRRVKFIEEEKGGYSKKFRIEDGAGREWVAKIGKEAQSETAAVRLVWAAGYETEVNYLVPRLTIPGKGTFENVRLEARPKNEKRLEEWKWKENPFVGSQELQGLKVLMLLLSNWDIKDSNNEIISVKGTDQLRFIISDLGATFGKTGNLPLVWRFTRSRNNPEDYQKASFVEGMDEGFVDFHYGGKSRELFDDITVDQARWIGNLLGRLSPGQIKDAFRAANYDREDQAILTKSVLRRIDELRTLSRQSERDDTSKSDHSLRRE